MLNHLRSIVQQVNAASDIEQIYDIIVSQLSEVMNSEVCSIYLSNHDRSILTLTANKGLNPKLVNKAKLNTDQGIVGEIFRKAEYILTDDAPHHPSYHPFEDSGESESKAFLGVPLIYHRQPLGVLAVQRFSSAKYTEDDVSFMITLSAQLSGLIANAEVKADLKQPNRPGESKVIRSFSAIPGIAIAKGWVVTPLDDLEHIPARECNDVEQEILRFRAALASTRQEIRNLGNNLEGTLPKSQLSLFSAFEKMLSYNSLGRKVETLITQQKIWAPAALSRVVLSDIQQFNQLDDPYLKERGTDIRDLTQRVLNFLNKSKTQPASFPRNLILCSEHVTSSMIAEVPPKRLKGIISINGSSTSHAAIIARSMGIPALMGLRNCPLEQLDKKPLIIDGYNKRTLVAPSRAVLKDYRQRQESEQTLFGKLTDKKQQKSTTKTRDGHRVQLLINTSPNLMDSYGHESSADGVGLFRTEYLFLQNDGFPGESEQCEMYAKVLDHYKNKPVVLRTLDIGGDKNLPYFPIEEENPFLGWRGIRISLDHPEIFTTQLRAMLMANLDRGNLQISLPMISTLTEIERAKELVHQVYDEVKQEGKYSKKRFPFPKIGAVIEVPSAVYQIHRIVQRVDFISIGSNDLTQYMFAADRNNNRVSYLYNSLHPATLLAFKEICNAGQTANIPVHICGEIAANPLATMILVAMGIEAFSMNARSVPVIRKIISQMKYKQSEKIMSEVLACESSYDVLTYLKDLLHQQGLLELVDPISIDQKS